MIDGLRTFFTDDVISENLDHIQLQQIYMRYKADFVDTPLILDGKVIRIDRGVPKVMEYKDYDKTFYHIITRDHSIRIYDCKRANRVHWIKTILENRNHKDVLFYKWRDSNKICKEHYWAIHKGFIVVLKEISPNLQIVTAFCVDAAEKSKYYERFSDYKNGKSSCI